MRPRRRGLPILSILALVLSACPASGQQASSSAQPPANPPQARFASAQATPPRPQVVVEEGAVTMRGQDVSLRWLLEEISRQARIALVLNEQIADQKISIEFQMSPVLAAVQDLLRDYDVFYFCGVDDRPPARLKAVWVYPKGKGAGHQPVPPEDWASTNELEAATADNDPATRLNAIVSFIERN